MGETQPRVNPDVTQTPNAFLTEIEVAGKIHVKISIKIHYDGINKYGYTGASTKEEPKPMGRYDIGKWIPRILDGFSRC
jgi:hypothetical protein